MENGLDGINLPAKIGIPKTAWDNVKPESLQNAEVKSVLPSISVKTPKVAVAPVVVENNDGMDYQTKLIMKKEEEAKRNFEKRMLTKKERSTDSFEKSNSSEDVRKIEVKNSFSSLMELDEEEEQTERPKHVEEIKAEDKPSDEVKKIKEKPIVEETKVEEKPFVEEADQHEEEHIVEEVKPTEEKKVEVEEALPVSKTIKKKLQIDQIVTFLILISLISLVLFTRWDEIVSRFK